MSCLSKEFRWRKPSKWVGTSANLIKIKHVVSFCTLTTCLDRFWSREELVYTRSGSAALHPGSPPAPFGVLNQLFRGMVHWQAVADGMSTAIALGFLYVIRCSVHGAALKKNLPNLSRTVKDHEVEDKEELLPVSPKLAKPVGIRTRQFSEAVDIEAVMLPAPKTAVSSEPKKEVHVIHAKPSNITLKAILTPYGMSQFVAALFGGFACTPSVAASSTMFSVSAQTIRRVACSDTKFIDCMRSRDDSRIIFCSS